MTVLLQEEPGRRGRAMTRCECARVAFEEVAREVREMGLSAEAAIRRAGCGALCTACVPDLEAFLRRA